MAAHEAGRDLSQLRRRAGPARYIPPEAQRPKYVVSDRGVGRPLRNEHLIALADALARVEEEMFTRLLMSYNLVGDQDDLIDRGPDSLNVPLTSEMQEDVPHLHKLCEQYKAIRLDADSYTARYLEDNSLLHFWNASVSMVKYWSSKYPHEDNGLDLLPTAMKSITRGAEKLQFELINAASHGLMDPMSKNYFRRRWLLLEEMVLERNEGLSHTENTLTAWHVLAKSLPTTERIPTSQKKHGPSPTQRYPGGRYVTYWLTVAAIVSNITTFAMAFYHSPHQAGTSQEADFWMQAQNSIMQLLALATAGAGLREKGTIPRWATTGPTVVALLCAVVAVPLYCLVPTEWSALATTVASVTQAFMIVQLAFGQG